MPPLCPRDTPPPQKKKKREKRERKRTPKICSQTAGIANGEEEEEGKEDIDKVSSVHARPWVPMTS